MKARTWLFLGGAAAAAIYARRVALEGHGIIAKQCGSKLPAEMPIPERLRQVEVCVAKVPWHEKFLLGWRS